MIPPSGSTRVVTIDCESIATEEEFWERYVAEANPEGAELFGRNLDAFWDAVNGGPGWPGACCRLRFVNVNSIHSFRDGQFYEALCDIARDSQLVQIEIS